MEQLSMPTKTKAAAWFMIIAGIITVVLSAVLYLTGFIWFSEMTGLFYFIRNVIIIFLGICLLRGTKKRWKVAVAILSLELFYFVATHIIYFLSNTTPSHYKEFISQNYFNLWGFVFSVLPLLVASIPLILLLIDRKNLFKVAS